MSDTNNQKTPKIGAMYVAPSDEELIELFVNRKLTTKEISKQYQVSQSTVTRWLRKARKRNPEIFKERNKKNYPDAETLKRLYMDEEKTESEIAKLYCVSIPTASSWIQEAKKQGIIPPQYNVKRKHPGDDTLYHLLYEEHKSSTEISKIYNAKKATVDRWITKAKRKNPDKFVSRRGRHKYNRFDYNTLKQLYINEGKTAREIAELYNTSTDVVNSWIAYSRKKPQSFPYKEKKNNQGIDILTLKSLYIDQKLPTKKIAEMYNVTPNTVYLWVSKARKNHPDLFPRRKPGSKPR